MNFSDIAILTVLGIAIALALRSHIGRRRKGDCGCGCSSCGSNTCALRHDDEK